MTRAELIRKVARQNGIPDFEAKSFFETFLQKISEIIKPNQAVKVNGFGYFQKREAAVRSLTEHQKQFRSDVILFSPLDQKSESLIFNIPNTKIDSSDLIDSHFSLSINKPVIPLDGVKSSDIFLQPTGIELKKLIESKAEKLLTESEIVLRHINEGGILIIKKNSDGQFGLDLSEEELDHTQNEPILTDTNKTSEFEHVAWDFGEDLSKQIEEESILDLSTETSFPSSEEQTEGDDNFTWDFSIPKDIEETASLYNPVSEELEDIEQAKVNTQETVNQEIENDFEVEAKDEEPISDKDEYQRVKSLTSEFEPRENSFGLTKSEMNLSWDFNKHDETREIEETNEFEPDENPENYYMENSLDKERTFQSNNNEEILFEGNIISPQSNNAPLINVINEETKSNKFTYSRSRSPFVFFIAMVTILTVSAVLVVYISGNSFTKLINKLFGTNSSLTINVRPEIVERNYEIPVTYPYPKGNQAAISNIGIDPNVFQTNVQTSLNNTTGRADNLSSLLSGNKNQAPQVLSNKKQIQSVTPPTIEPTGGTQKVKGNIYISNGKYIVQVSSWKSKVIAESEAISYNKKGFNAMVEPAQVPGRGTWYRVKVGNFKTISEAEAFLNKKEAK